MEILGILEKVFYEGNTKLPGGKYTFTIVNIETGERIELKAKLGAKEDFVVGVIYRVEYHEDNIVRDMETSIKDIARERRRFHLLLKGKK